jgi:hypothetical protein
MGLWKSKVVSLLKGIKNFAAFKTTKKTEISKREITSGLPGFYHLNLVPTDMSIENLTFKLKMIMGQYTRLQLVLQNQAT